MHKPNLKKSSAQNNLKYVQFTSFNLVSVFYFPSIYIGNQENLIVNNAAY